MTIHEGSGKRGIFDISIAIPAYSRSSELTELLASIFHQTVLPCELTICEDGSAERAAIRSLVQDWEGKFAAEGCRINYHENEVNLGFDGNLRKVIATSNSRWVMLMGNDDMLLKDCIETAEEYLKKNPETLMSSRSFERFEKDSGQPLGVSRISRHDQVFRSHTSSSRMIFRATGFVSGLIVNREWAIANATERYDGTLYYQIYLASLAFCESGLGYVAKPIVGGRSGNTPLFGSASSEKQVHAPGSYAPKGRAKMWESVLRITREVGEQFSIDLVTDIREELEVRQSFHIFEMYAGSGRKILSEVRVELTKLGLFRHPLPRFLYALDYVLGRKALFFYSVMRRVMQRS